MKTSLKTSFMAVLVLLSTAFPGEDASAWPDWNAENHLTKVQNSQSTRLATRIEDKQFQARSLSGRTSASQQKTRVSTTTHHNKTLARPNHASHASVRHHTSANQTTPKNRATSEIRGEQIGQLTPFSHDFHFQPQHQDWQSGQRNQFADGEPSRAQFVAGKQFSSPRQFIQPQPLNQADFASMQQRLDRTIRAGRLTPKKAWHLQTKLNRIRYMQGVINASGANWHEQKKLWQSMQSISKSIAAKEGHNWQLDSSPYGRQSQLP